MKGGQSMTRKLKKTSSQAWKFGLALAAPLMLSATASAYDANNTPQIPKQLEAVIEAYVSVYFALGACDGFIPPEKEAQFDPFGPALEKWPESIKRLMVHAREEGRISGKSVAREKGLTFDERTELCQSQIDSAADDLESATAKYEKVAAAQ
jgi:hypothetical protein